MMTIGKVNNLGKAEGLPNENQGISLFIQLINLKAPLLLDPTLS